MRSIASITFDVLLAVRNVHRQSRRSAFGLASISAGVMALVIASGFFAWNLEAMREGTIRTRIGHLQIQKAGFAKQGGADPLAFLMPDDRSMLRELEAQPQVEYVVPKLQLAGLISAGEKTVSFIGEGFDVVAEGRSPGILKLLSGRNLTTSDVRSIMLGEGLANTLGLSTGQSVVLMANTRSGSVNAIECVVVGVFATVSKAYDDYAIRLPLASAQKLLRESGIHKWVVYAKETSATEGLRDTFSAGLQAKGLVVVPWDSTPEADFYNKTVTLFTRQVLVVKVMIAIIIVLSISNTLMTSVRERIAEVGTRLAIGESIRLLRLRFVLEGAVLGVAGGILGLILGISLATAINQFGIPMPPPPGMASGFRGGILVTPSIVLQSLGIAFATALLASIFPAWHASNLPIHEALRRAE